MLLCTPHTHHHINSGKERVWIKSWLPRWSAQLYHKQVGSVDCVKVSKKSVCADRWSHVSSIGGKCQLHLQRVLQNVVRTTRMWRILFFPLFISCGSLNTLAVILCCDVFIFILPFSLDFKLFSMHMQCHFVWQQFFILILLSWFQDIPCTCSTVIVCCIQIYPQNLLLLCTHHDCHCCCTIQFQIWSRRQITPQHQQSVYNAQGEVPDNIRFSWGSALLQIEQQWSHLLLDSFILLLLAMFIGLVLHSHTVLYCTTYLFLGSGQGLEK